MWTLREKNLALLGFIWLIYLSNFRWRGAGDCVGASLQPFAFLRNGTLYLDEYRVTFFSDPTNIAGAYLRNGHWITKYPSAAGILLTPFYVLSVLGGVQPTDLLVHQLQKIGASFMVVLSAWFLLNSLSRFVERRWAVILTLAYALGTESLSTSSQGIWQHGPSQLFIALGVYALFCSQNNERWIWLSGFSLGMAVWCRYSDLFIFAFMGLYLWLARDRFRALRWTLSSLPPAACVFADNYFHGGHFFQTGYSELGIRFTLHFVEGFLGLLFSPARGLFLYSPFVLFSIWGFALAWRSVKWRFWRVLSLACVATVFFYSTYTDWPGGWCFGPRYMADIGPLLVLGVVPLLERLERSVVLRKFFFLSLFYSILVHAIGAAFTWHWEDLTQVSVWNTARYPVIYLIRQVFISGGPDRIEGLIVLLALISMIVWFLIPGNTRRWHRDEHV